MLRFFLVAGAVLGGLGVAGGALGAHALKSALTPRFLELFETAVRYQLFHALALLIVGTLTYLDTRPARSRILAGWFFFAGILLFSGSLYAYIATGTRVFVHVTPFGGLSLITGWILLAVHGARIITTNNRA